MAVLITERPLTQLSSIKVVENFRLHRLIGLSKGQLAGYFVDEDFLSCIRILKELIQSERAAVCTKVAVSNFPLFSFTDFHLFDMIVLAMHQYFFNILQARFFFLSIVEGQFLNLIALLLIILNRLAICVHLLLDACHNLTIQQRIEGLHIVAANHLALLFSIFSVEGLFLGNQYTNLLLQFLFLENSVNFYSTQK